ncbi:MAG: hypothetical protein ACRC0S_00360 [Fusobacteriaceae bacterium]
MKKLLVIFTMLTLVIFAGCSSLFSKDSKEVEKLTKEDVKAWNVTLEKSIVKNASMPEWYGEENPVFYLRKTGKMSEKEFFFLTSLEKKDITNEDIEKFSDLVKKYNKKMPRKFFLKDENIKYGKGLAEKIVKESYQRMNNPSNHIFNEVATEKEWKKIVELSKKEDLTTSDTKELRKILNKFIKREEFFESKSWYNKEVSERTTNIVSIYTKENKTSIEKNNVNAKALYIAYEEYFSKMDRWDN